MGCGESKGYDPDRIDYAHFNFLRVAGKGGYGKVDSVKYKATGETMAIKRISKHKIAKSKPILRSVWIERRIMGLLESPFILKVNFAFQDPYELFLVMPYKSGGDLRYYLSTKKRMKTKIAQFYAAQILLGLEEMHKAHIMYRDLKPDNCLLDENGNMCLSDFGVSDRLPGSGILKARAGTQAYMAPEVDNRQQYSYSADYYSFGVTLCEMITGKRPYQSASEKQEQEDHKKQMVEAKKKAEAMGVEVGDNVKEALKEDNDDEKQGDKDEDRAKKLEGPGTKVPDSSSRLSQYRNNQHLNADSLDLIDKLVQQDRKDRLGDGPGGIQDIMDHKFFADVDWDAMRRLEVEPPYKPKEGVSHCMPHADIDQQLMGEMKPPKISKEEQQKFYKWEFNTDPNHQIGFSEKKVVLDNYRRRSFSGSLSHRPTHTTTLDVMESN